MLTKFKAIKKVKVLNPSNLKQIKGGTGGLLTEDMELVVEDMDRM